MRHLSILSISLFLLIFGCGQKEPSDSSIIITGKLVNSESKEIELYVGDELNSFVIDDDGSFLIHLESDDFSLYNFGTDRRFFQLFLRPGDSIYVTADAKDFRNSFQLSGDRIPENTYLVEKDKFYFESNLMDLMEKDKDSYFEGKLGFFNRQKALFEKLQDEYEIHQDFLKIEEAYFEFQPLLHDIQYPNYHAYFNDISVEEVDFPVHETKAKLAKIDLERLDLLNVRDYTSIIHFIIGEKANEILIQDTLLDKDPEGYEKATLLAIENLLKNQFVKDHFHYKHVKSNLDYKGPIHTKSSIDKFLAENQSNHLEVKLKKDIEKWDPIMPGKETPDFSFEDTSGETVRLSDLRGNLVYIDIWASWCKPCIEEHPHWDQLKADYEDQPISFLTISIDENKDAWKKMVISKNMEGLQWIAEKAWRSDLNLYFMVNSIPRFILLDREGKIIDPNAERPSGDIRKTMDKFL